MNNKTIIALIVIVAVGTIGIVAWKTPSSETPETRADQTTDTPTAIVESNEGDNPFTTTDTPTPTVTSTPTVTATATVTPTPTATPATSDFDTNVNSDWLYGVKEQNVGNVVYFINSSDKKKVMKGSSASDASATTVFTSDTNGEIGSFVVNGGSMFVVVRRDTGTSLSKFKKVNLSSGSAARLYDLYSTKYSATQFAVRDDANTSAGFYIGLEGVNGAYAPAALYVKSYVQEWIKPFDEVTKGAEILGLGPNSDLSLLLGLFTESGTQEEGAIVLVEPTPTP